MIISTEGRIGRNSRANNNTAIDIHIMKASRLRPTQLSICKEEFRIELNITFQQVQKYGCGGKRRNWLVPIKKMNI